MQTNSASGHHQHEVSEKRLAPGAFPCRVDMEICACGARRWVDQNGTPTTPWQFINLGTKKPAGNEGARVVPPTSPKSALEGLITCGNCGKPMVLDDTQDEREASYSCQPGHSNLWAQCQTPRLHARRTEVLLVRHGAAHSPDRGERVLAGDGGKRPPAVRRSTRKPPDQAGREGSRGRPRSAWSWRRTAPGRADISWAKSSPRYRSTRRQQSSATRSRCRETALWRECAGRKSTCRRKY